MAHLSSQRLPKPSSVKVFKLLNHNLAWLLHNIFRRSQRRKRSEGSCLTRYRYARRELMFRNELRSGATRSSTKKFESSISIFRVQDIPQGAWVPQKRTRSRTCRTVELHIVHCPY